MLVNNLEISGQLKDCSFISMRISFWISSVAGRQKHIGLSPAVILVENALSVSATCCHPSFGFALSLMLSASSQQLKSIWPVLFYLLFASLLLQACTSSWLPLPRQEPYFLLLFKGCFHYITSSSVCFSLLHLPLPPHDYLHFLALLSLKQAIFPLWRKCSVQSLGMVLNSHRSQSLLQLPKRELSRYIFSCQRAKVLRRILYFCQSFSIVTITYPDHIA